MSFAGFIYFRPEVTTIDASGISGAYHVVQCVSGEDANTVLDGFTITGGNANGPDPNDQSGGGMFNHQSSPTVINCMFIGNTAVYYGGGMSNINNSSPMVTNCAFSGNNAGFGGGMHTMSNSTTTVTNCTFSGNTANYYGGGMRNFQSNSTVTNCTFSGNTVTHQRGGGMNNYDSSTTITNCIFWENAPDEIYDAKISSIVSYSDVQGGWPGQGNIDADPCFTDTNNGDYHLKSQAGRWDANSENWVTDANTSVAIDAGDPNSDWTAELWPHGKRINMGAYGGIPEASMSLLPLGNIADLNNDDIVNFQDFACIAGTYQAEGVLLSEDLNRNNKVNGIDLYIFISNWLLEE